MFLLMKIINKFKIYMKYLKIFIIKRKYFSKRKNYKMLHF